MRFLSKALQQRVQPLEYRQGELHLYQGIRYPLMINITTGKKNPVIHTAHEFIVNTHSAKPAKVEALLQAWYQRQAFIVFDERLKTVAARADWVGERQVPLKLRRMKRTWGNCSSSGVIKLNTHLIKAPTPVIDSVIAHELCHLVEMNHGRGFYRLLSTLNPDWQQHRQQLLADGSKYLN